MLKFLKCRSSSLMLFIFALTIIMSNCFSGTARAEGFAMSEWSARGLSLAGGMIGRADDVSTLAYNAAGITQLPGTHLMAGASFIAPYGGIQTFVGGVEHLSNTKPNIWVPGHGYVSHQLTDDLWLGLAVYSRFGLGNSYNDDWAGRYNVYGVGITTVSAVPTIAYKFNDIFSASLGVEIMYLDMFLNKRAAVGFGGVFLGEASAQLEGSSVGVGIHAGLHARFNDQWSAGLAYKSQMTHNVSGTAEFAGFGANRSLFPLFDDDIHGTIQLPDSLAFGITYRPLENLSFEVGAIYTRWSTFNHLNIYFENPLNQDALSQKQWKDGWNINASVEYAPLDWLTLRAGYWHETDVTNNDYHDYMMPTNGRDALTLGVGFEYEDWTLDLGYAHFWIYDTHYDGSVAGTTVGQSKNVGADVYSVSIGYSF